MFRRILWPVDPQKPKVPPTQLLRVLNGGKGDLLRMVAVLQPLDQMLASDEWAQDPDLKSLWRVSHSDLKQQLRSLAKKVAGDGLTVETTVIEGHAVVSLLREIAVSRCDLLMIRTQTEGGNGKGMGIGGVTFDLLLQSTVPVCCVRDLPEGYALRQLVVATDLSESAVSAFETALTLAEQDGARVTLVHLITQRGLKLDDELKEQLHENAKLAMKVWRESAKHDEPRRVLVTEEILHADDAAEGIIARAQELTADMIVVASQGWSGQAGVFFGSTARRVVRNAKVPVLVTRQTRAAI